MRRDERVQVWASAPMRPLAAAGLPCRQRGAEARGMAGGACVAGEAGAVAHTASFSLLLPV